MKFKTHVIIGVFIGSFNILINIICIILAIFGLVNLILAKKSADDVLNSYHFALLVVNLLMIVVCGLLLKGILKRRPKLMLPWLILNGIAFVLNCVQYVVTAIFQIIDGNTRALEIGIGVFLSLLTVGITALIYWLILDLYRKICKENNKYCYVNEKLPELMVK